MSEFAQTDLPDRIRASGLPLESAVIVGSGTLEILGIRRAQDIDMVVTPDVYRRLRESPDFEEEVSPMNGFRHLFGRGLDVSVNWGDQKLKDLQSGSYMHQGVRFAGLPDLYAHKQERDLDKDRLDLELIKQRLYDSPLPKSVLGKDLDFVQGIIPEHLRDHPAVHVAANGLYIVRTVFGHEDEGVRTYSGSVERGAVPATYHAWEHSAFGARDGQESMNNGDDQWRREGRPGTRYSNNERLSGLGYTNHDGILGHGRQAANPGAHDEKQAGEMLVRHLEAAGVADEQLLEGSYETVIVTTWREQTKSQNIDPLRGHLPQQENGAAMDMSALRCEDGPVNASRLVPEDLGRIGAGYVGPSGERGPLDDLVRELNAQRPAGTPPIRIKTSKDGWRLIEAHPDYPVTKMTPNGPIQMTLRAAAGGHLIGSGGYYRSYRFPDRWLHGDSAVQEQSADELVRIGEGVVSGSIPPSQVMELTQAYRDRVRAARQSSGSSKQAPGGDTAVSDKTGGRSSDDDQIIGAIRRIIDTMRTDGEE